MNQEQAAEVSAGSDAADLLASRGWQAARAHMRAGIEQQMARAPLNDGTLHTRLILTLQCLNAIEGYLEQAKQTGEWTAFQVQQEREAEQAKRGLLARVREFGIR